jgi:hypothetical protein
VENLPDFSNLKDLERYLQQQAAKVLKTDVAKIVTQEMSDTIKEVEYPKYQSNAANPYDRLGDDGGLSDIRNMQIEIIDDNTISITNERMDGGVDVAKIFADGIGYSWKHSEIYNMQPFPRDFYADTVERLKSSGQHLIAFKQGMARLGFKVE